VSAGRRVRLGDGRILAYQEWGAPGGHPVLECHGNPGSRVLLWDERELVRLGVRLITADRPGIGGSTPMPGRTVAAWADDAEELLGELGVERAAVLGYSVGGAYAAACAHRLGDRVASLALVSSVMPLDHPDAVGELGHSRQWQLARAAPRLASAAVSTQVASLRLSPRLVSRLFVAALPEPDRAAVRRHPSLVPQAVAMGREAARQGGGGLVEDLRTVMRPWGFRLGEIAAPTTVWQGDRDRSIPPSWGERLAAEIPGARLRTCPGEGHLLLVDRLAEVLQRLTVPV
jgi:pimeloyl-ACP methyl ester carboxylesterase